MSNSQIDGNYKGTLIGVSSDDFITPENAAVDPITHELRTQPRVLLPTEGNNPSTALSYDENGDLQYIDETIGGTTYRTTLTYSSRVLVGISEAVEI